MYSARQRRQQVTKSSSKPTSKVTSKTSSKSSSSKVVATPTPSTAIKSKQGKLSKKMIEEEEDDDTTSSDYEDEERMEEESKEEKVIDKNTERQRLRELISDETVDAVRLDRDLILAITERYEELLKELYQADDVIESLHLTPEAREILNEKAALWIEYFLANSTIRDPKANIFTAMASFIKTNKFV